LLVADVGVQVDVGRGELFMAEPEGDHGDVIACEHEAHRRGVPQRVHGDPLCADGRADCLRQCDVVGEPMLDGVSAEAPSRTRGKEWVVRRSSPLVEEGLEDLDRARDERVRRSFLPLPKVCTLALWPRVTSAQLSPTSSEIRSPVWIVRANIV
jgi:hypothetical protein